MSDLTRHRTREAISLDHPLTQAAIFERLAAWSSAGEPFVLALVTQVGGSTPRLEGAQMWVSRREQVGTVGGGAFEHLVVREARELISRRPRALLQEVSAHLTHELGMCCGGKMSALLKLYPAPERVYVMGAGHVGTALAKQLTLLERAVTVVDERAEWASPERFSQEVSVRCEDPESWLRASPPQGGGALLIMTHDHELDERLMSLALPLLERGELSYLGMIGSAGKWGRFKRRLKERGFSEALLEHVRCPVGLSIGAESPAEIAVSVCAELIEGWRAAQR